MIKPVIVNGQEIVGPSPRHFMDARAGRGTGFAVCSIEEKIFMEHNKGKFKPVLFKVQQMGFVALDRRNPKRICTALPIAGFFLN